MKIVAQGCRELPGKKRKKERLRAQEQLVPRVIQMLGSIPKQELYITDAIKTVL